MTLVIFSILFMSISTAVAHSQYSFNHLSTEDEDHILFSTAGPLKNRYVSISLINGSEQQISRINTMITSRIAHAFLPLNVIPVDHLNFTVTFKKNVVLPRSGKAFYTSVAMYNDGAINQSNTIINKKHSIIVKDFAGYFLFSRSHPFKLCAGGPAKFMFVGSCEQVLVLT